MTEQAERAIKIIRAVRDFDTFTARKAHMITSIPLSTVHLLMKHMNNNGIISLSGKVKGENHYKVSSSAIQKIKETFVELMPLPYGEREEKDVPFGKMTVVKKANVKDMGCPRLKRIDSLLSGVRV